MNLKKIFKTAMMIGKAPCFLTDSKGNRIKLLAYLTARDVLNIDLSNAIKESDMGFSFEEIIHLENTVTVDIEGNAMRDMIRNHLQSGAQYITEHLISPEFPLYNYTPNFLDWYPAGDDDLIPIITDTEVILKYHHHVSGTPISNDEIAGIVRSITGKLPVSHKLFNFKGHKAILVEFYSEAAA